MNMRMKLNTIIKFLNKELQINRILDTSVNGLQVKGSEEVKKVGFAVDACLSTFKKAKQAGVNLLIVHHGVKWRPQKHKELAKQRIDFLKKNKISLYAAHLPLDAHQKYGNNIGLCEILELKNILKFGRYGFSKIGYKGKFETKKTIKQISNRLNNSLNTKCVIYPFGKKQIKTIAIVSGGGAGSIGEAAKEKLDCFLTGEIKHSTYHQAKEHQLNLIVAGHYATETIGVKSLQKLLKQEFNLKTVFISNPTGM